MTTGSKTCNWEEDPIDTWDWRLVTGGGGTFLYTSQEGGTEAEGSMARIHSPMYQNSRASCLLSFYYYVHGLSGNTFFKPGLHSLYPTEEIVLDYLGNTNVNKPAIELLT